MPGRQCNVSTDSWFIGQLMFVMATGGQAPWDGLNHAEVVQKLRRGELPELPSTVNPNLKRLVRETM